MAAHIRPKGRELVERYLIPRALHGYVFPGLVAEGVDIFSTSPGALYFSHNHRNHDEAWCYFFGPQPAADWVPVPGGCWFSYGGEKAYSGGNGGEALAFRRRFRYHVMLQQGLGDGSGVWVSTRWLMTEFRLNKNAGRMRAASFQAELGLLPDANLDCVVRKVFTKPAVP